MSERKSLLLIFVGCLITSVFISEVHDLINESKKSNREYQHKIDSLEAVKDSIFRLNDLKEPNYKDLYE